MLRLIDTNMHTWVVMYVYIYLVMHAILSSAFANHPTASNEAGSFRPGKEDVCTLRTGEARSGVVAKQKKDVILALGQ